MAIDHKAVQDRLKKFDFAGLFTQELGWDWHTSKLSITADGCQYDLEAVAHKRGMVVYHCPARPGARIPEYPVRRKVEHQVTKTTREHLIIFTDAGQTTQIWQWVKREPGKPAACRERTYHKGHSGEALVQRLQEIVFLLDDEEKTTLLDVTSKNRKAFDVERITKKFYDRFQKEHTAFLKFIEGITEGTDREWYASVMLNRLMFVYFIQRKGFLDGDEHYLRNRLARCQHEKGADKFYSFYRYFLLRLFHEGFGKRPKDRAADLEKLVGRIPYLNGGFFEQHQIEQHYKNIEIPDKAFERIFDYFDQYQWHLDERPLRADNEINPDVLGFIFEKYINQKQMGAYYTQEDITGYICRNTIIPFLFDAARKEHKAAFEGDNAVWKLLQTDPDRYIYTALKHGITLNVHTTPHTPLSSPSPFPEEIEQGVDTAKPNLIERRKRWNKPAPSEYALPTEIWREVVARRQRYEELHSKLAAGEVRDINDLITLNLDIVQFAQDVIRNCDTPELLRAFWHPLEKISVLDPTVGSGAFLFAALNILKPLYEACLERMEAFVGDLDRSGAKHRPEKFKHFREVMDRVDAHPNTDYFILKSIILSNLYGVDIMEEATEICKLRLFLKLAAQVEHDPTKENLGIEPLPDIDFNIRAGNTLVGYATADEVRRAFKEEAGGQGKLLLGESSNAYRRFEESVELADRAFRQFREMQTKRGMDSSQFASAKITLRKQIKALEDQLNNYLATDCGVKASDKTSYSRWLASHAPFHWFIEFYGIVSSGGFDVVIGNPPYVEFSRSGVTYKVSNYATAECDNLWAFVLERALRLMSGGGRMSLITPLSLVSSARFAPAYQEVARVSRLATLLTLSGDAHPSVLFAGVKMSYTIFTCLKAEQQVSQCQIYISKLYRWLAAERENLFALVQYHPALPLSSIGIPFKAGSSMAARVIRKLITSRVTIAHLERKTGTPMLYHRIVRHFIKALFTAPYFYNERDGEKKSEDYKVVLFENESTAKIVRSFLVSSTYYLFFVALSDAYHCGRDLVLAFPVDIQRLPKNSNDALIEIGVRHERDLFKHSVRRRIRYRATGWIEYDEFYPRESKVFVDEIDPILAAHYGFTDEELDFIINYDVKYRLGFTGDEGD